MSASGVTAPSLAPSQLTAFYGGTVCVFDAIQGDYAYCYHFTAVGTTDGATALATLQAQLLYPLPITNLCKLHSGNSQSITFSCGYQSDQNYQLQGNTPFSAFLRSDGTGTPSI
ncbi:hypothetical protein V6N13_113233 [Hibiscus sabdariffa]